MEENYIICKVCGEKVKRLYGAHLKSHGLTSQEYKLKYPGELLTTELDNKNTTKNSGKHMKTEKYKHLFSEKFKGESNPNHKSKVSEGVRKERSPFSIEFYKKKYPNLSDKEIDKLINKFREKSFEGIINTTQIQYWINKGYELEEATEKRSERQRTFTLEKCIEKYGEKDGKIIYNDRQERWQKSLLDNGNLKFGYSKVSQDLFNTILPYYKKSVIKYIFYATKNYEYVISDDIGFCKYDFTDLKNNKIIEFNGDVYHANPSLYNENDTPHPFRKISKSSEIWKEDKDKIELAEKYGFEVMIVWENDYTKDKEKVLQDCLKFLDIK